MKGIILAGGNGTRLFPITLALSKQLMPIYDKPMIYYPLSTLMLAGIHDILIITTPEDQGAFIRLLGDGSKWGITLTYAIQPSAHGIAQAFLIGDEFIGKDDVCLVLGDNIFYGAGLSSLLLKCKTIVETQKRSVIFGYEVSDPARYGVVELDSEMSALSIEEKPTYPRSNYAVVGLYFYTNDVIQIAKKLEPSKRGELEITSISNYYLQAGKLNVEIMNRGYAWLDTGTFESMLHASNFIEIIEKRQGIKIACPEEIAWENKWISDKDLQILAEGLTTSNYGVYLLKLLK